jgi:hypothetical protein
MHRVSTRAADAPSTHAAGAPSARLSSRPTWGAHHSAASPSCSNKSQKSAGLRPSSVPVSQSDWAPTPARGRPLEPATRGLANCKHFRDFNTEQQGDICQAYWRAKRNGTDTSAYEPYIHEVQNGGVPRQCGPAQKKG